MDSVGTLICVPVIETGKDLIVLNVSQKINEHIPCIKVHLFLFNRIAFLAFFNQIFE